MTQYIIIAACLIVGLVGIVGAIWSIHRTHSRIHSRHDQMFERVDRALRMGTKIVE
jgi:hypothetical protein